MTTRRGPRRSRAAYWRTCPPEEVARYADIYAELDSISAQETEYRRSLYQVRALMADRPDAAKLTPAELLIANERMSQVLMDKDMSAAEQRNISAVYPEFAEVPSRADLDRLMKMTLNAEQQEALKEFHRRQDAITR